LPNKREQQLENDGVLAEISWTVRLKDDVTDDTISLAEKEIGRTASKVGYSMDIFRIQAETSRLRRYPNPDNLAERSH
jgi:hypothetical protein